MDIRLDIYLTPQVKINGKTVEICDSLNGDQSHLTTEFDCIQAHSLDELNTKLAVFEGWNFNKDEFTAKPLNSNQVPNLVENITSDGEFLNDFCSSFNVTPQFIKESMTFNVVGYLKDCTDDDCPPICYNELN